ncbi:hypothetical protein C7271_02580 [filamentous cyanobacterium CCP5]|nr:hypothetical protein C7271_02580 [filamentous cyanobacterium CCP5]
MAQVSGDDGNSSTSSENSGGQQPASAEDLDLPEAIINESPVLREWLEQTPDIADEILHDPSFPTRVRVGYAHFPSTGQAAGIQVGVEDWFVISGRGLTISGNYARSFDDQRQSYGAEARYYLLPLGEYFNLAPVVGYRHLDTPDYGTEGINIGFRVVIVPSRGGGADIAISQTWIAPGTQSEVGVTGLSVGYGITQKLRIATDVQFQNSQFGQNSRLGVALEYVP